jgi:hypothetical protein
MSGWDGTVEPSPPTIYNNQLNDYGGYYNDEDNEDTTDEGNILQST